MGRRLSPTAVWVTTVSTPQFPAPVESALEQAFPDVNNRTQARDRLLSLDSLPANSPRERVMLAVLALAAGDLTAVSHFVERAIKDWRDVIYWAENPRDPDEPKSWEELQRRLGLKGRE